MGISHYSCKKPKELFLALQTWASQAVRLCKILMKPYKTM